MTKTVWITVVASLLAFAPAPSYAGPRAGLRMHVDPKTGADVPNDSGEVSRPERAVAPAPPTAGVEAVPGPLAPAAEAVPVESKRGGGMLDVRGRFRSEMQATVTPDGDVKVRCVHPGEGND